MNSTLDIKATCTKCKKEVAGRIHFDRRMKVVDTDGGMAFAEGWTCHDCLGEPWSSSDLAVKL